MYIFFLDFFFTLFTAEVSRTQYGYQYQQNKKNQKRSLQCDLLIGFVFCCYYILKANLIKERSDKKIRSTLACTSSFLTFFTIIHSRGQRYVVPLSIIKRNPEQFKCFYSASIPFDHPCCLMSLNYYHNEPNKSAAKKKYSTLSCLHILMMSSPIFTAEVSGTQYR